MTEVLVRLVSDDHDLEAVRGLCREWLKWHWNNYPSGWPEGEDHPMHPTNFNAILADLPELHQRPSGGILIAVVDEEPAGCVMYRAASPGVAEFNRMYVSTSGRGHGLGGKLLESMFEHLVADKYQSVFFSSATFLTHARTMYEKAGFVPMAQPQDLPAKWRDKVYFMERSLV